jgi:DNA-binding transcriptional MerR regulator
MLRHYDAIGLLRPARVNPSSGYRFYTAAQLGVLNRVVALKDLGFTLAQIKTMIDEKVDTAELRGMLRLRRAQLAEQVATDTDRLARVDARLRMIETEGNMRTADVVLKTVPAMRVVELSAPAASYLGPDIAVALTPLYPQLMERMAAAGVAMIGAPIAYYLPAPTGPGDESITVHAAFPVAAGSAEQPGPGGQPAFDVVDLPPIERAATLLHHGSMMESFRTGQVIAEWIDESGYTTVGAGYGREVYLDCPPGETDRWVTEIQIEVAPAAG